MKEIALHIMDVAENGISAGASLIRILLNEDRKNNLLTVEIEDNGRGMSAELAAKVTDPFITSRTTRRVGLGLSLLQAAAHRCEGEFRIDSEPGKGTLVFASFRYDHIDRAPVGDAAGSLTALMMGNPNIDFVYTHQVDGHDFTLDTAEIRKDMEGFSLTDPAVMVHLTRTIRNAVSELRTNINKGDMDDKS
jgi:anti-sigma regulatory factor (Ser/Thr protein kinase)